MQTTRALVACVVLLTIFTTGVRAYPSNLYWPRNDILNQLDPSEIADMIDTLNTIMMERISKRGLDLGLSRGYTGTVQAKHLMGLAAANYAGGPGRRRRSVL